MIETTDPLVAPLDLLEFPLDPFWDVLTLPSWVSPPEWGPRPGRNVPRQDK